MMFNGECVCAVIQESVGNDFESVKSRLAVKSELIVLRLPPLYYYEVASMQSIECHTLFYSMIHCHVTFKLWLFLTFIVWSL